jgi:hypothetical protein
MEMPSVELAQKAFPKTKKQFCGGVAGLGLRAAGMKADCFLEKEIVVVEIVFPNQQSALMILPMYKKQLKAAVEKEKNEKGDCIGAKVFIKED